jgi:ribose 5-phosphate isomerase B
MASNSSVDSARTLTPIRIVVGSDNAGHYYKEAIKKVLESHAGVAEVLDVGVHDASDSTAYPHPAVDACKKIKAGEVSTTRILSPLVAVAKIPLTASS